MWLLFIGNKPHACHICPKRFALACNLRAHLKTHQDEDNDMQDVDDDNTSLLMESQTEEDELQAQEVN